VVVLTGWSGQVSLGQMSFVAVGAVVGAKAVGEWGWDLSLTLLLAGAAGAVVAVVIGVPALRLRGPLLGVTTLAFAVASTQYLLNRSNNSAIPRERFTSAQLFAYFDLGDVRTLFVVTVSVTALGLVLVRGIRTSRSGRVLLALRDNEQAASSYGISVMRAKLSAFAVSGAMAGVAGGLYVQALRQYSEGPFEPAVSFNVFTASVVGGLGSLTGAVIGALFLNGGRWVFTGDLADWQLLPSAVGVLFVLMALPGGLGELVFRGRDALLRRVADRRGLVVPSLVADVRTDDLERDVAVLTEAADEGRDAEVVA
jgi:branched-chain amino acid transport system permease protein